MSIERVETFVVEQKLERPFSFSQWEYERRGACLVRITTQNEAYGWGEGYGPARVVEAGVRYLVPLILGEDPLHEGALWQTMYRRSLDYARRGVLVAALRVCDFFVRWTGRDTWIGLE